jgi:hypothetical protein
VEEAQQVSKLKCVTSGSRFEGDNIADAAKEELELHSEYAEEAKQWRCVIRFFRAGSCTAGVQQRQNW